MTTRIILLLVIFLNANISFAGTNFTDITSTITIHDLSSGWSSSSPISKQEQERRFELIKKIEAIQKQFEEEERRLTMGMSNRYNSPVTCKEAQDFYIESNRNVKLGFVKCTVTSMCIIDADISN